MLNTFRTLRQKFLWTFWNIGILYLFFSIIFSFALLYSQSLKIRTFPSKPINIIEQSKIVDGAAISIHTNTLTFFSLDSEEKIKDVYFVNSKVDKAIRTRIATIYQLDDEFNLSLSFSEIARLSINYSISLNESIDLTLNKRTSKQVKANSVFTIKDISSLKVSFGTFKTAVLKFGEINAKIKSSLDCNVELLSVSNHLLGDIDNFTLGELDDTLLFEL